MKIGRDIYAIETLHYDATVVYLGQVISFDEDTVCYLPRQKENSVTLPEFIDRGEVYDDELEAEEVLRKRDE